MYCFFLRTQTVPVEVQGMEAVQSSGWGACLEIWRSLVQDSLWPLVEFDPGSTLFNFSAPLVNSQLVCLRPVGILKLLLFCRFVHWVSLALKSPYGEWLIMYICICIYSVPTERRVAVSWIDKSIKHPDIFVT